jgi:outer membrane protein TolC
MGALDAPKFAVSISSGNAFAVKVVETNPTVQTFSNRVAQAESHWVAIRAETKPSLTLNMGSTVDREGNPMLVRESSTFVNLQLTVPLYEGGGGSAKADEARLQLELLRSEAEDFQYTLQSQAMSTVALYRSAVAEYSARVEQLRACEVALDGTARELEVGSKTLLDVLNAEQELADAKYELLASQVAEVEALARMQALEGVLAPGSAL